MLLKKQKGVDALDEIFKCNGVYLFDYRGLKVSEFEALRRKIRELNANVRVIKNRLAIKYFEKGKTAIGRELFNGPVAIAYSNEKFVETAKVLIDFEKESKKIKVRSGFIERQLVDEKQIGEVARLPGKPHLMTQILLSMAMPLRKFGSALSAPMTGMLILLKNLKEKKEKGG